MAGWTTIIAATGVALGVMLGAAGSVLAQAPPQALGAEGPRITSTAPLQAVPNYREALRDMVETLAVYGKGRNRNLSIILRQGLGLLIHSPWEARIAALEAGDRTDIRQVPAGTVKRRFVQNLDGVVLDGQFCTDPVTASPGYLALIAEIGLIGVVVDHCGSTQAATEAWREARKAGLLAHADSGTGPLGRIPGGPPFGENPDNVFTLARARNILMVDDNSSYATKADWLLALRQTNHDALVIDAFHRNRTPLTPHEVASLKTKHMGARRLVLARLNVTEASDTRWYWKNDWRPGSPEWLGEEDLDTPGRFTVRFWHPGWQALMGEAFTGLLQLGFDGVVLEGMEAYQPLEDAVNLEGL